MEVIEHHPCTGDFGSRMVCGTVVNNTSRTIGYAQIEINLYDSEGSLIDSTLDNINTLEPSGKWKFKAPILCLTSSIPIPRPKPYLSKRQTGFTAISKITLWLNFKNEYEVKLNKLNAELQRYQNANVDYMQTGIKLLEICHKASLPYSKISHQEIAQMVWQTYSSVTVQGKSVKLKFAEPFDTIEKLVQTARQGIEEYGYDKFFEVLKQSKNDCIQSIKKEPEGSVSNCFTCMKWWRIGDSNS